MWYTVFDIETTGLDKFRDDVIQFGYLIINEKGEKLRSECLYMYRDGMVMSEGSYNVHGISLDFLSKYKDQFIQNLVKIAVAVNRAYTVTYNGDRFDVPFLENYLSRNMITNSVILGNYDVMKLMGHRKKLTETVKILNISDEELRANHERWFGLSEGKAHDACYDVTMTATCFLKILENNKEFNSSEDYIEIKNNENIQVVKATIQNIDFIVLTNTEPILIPISDIDSVIKYGIYSNYSFDLDILDNIKNTKDTPSMFKEGVGPMGLKLELDNNMYKIKF